MIDVTTIDAMLETVGTGDALQEIDYQLTMLMDTMQGTIPLDRGLGVDMSYMDKSTPTAKTLYTAAITAAVAAFIPTVRVQEVTWTADENGNFEPKVVITSV